MEQTALVQELDIFIPWTRESSIPVLFLKMLLSHFSILQRAGARDDKGNFIIRDFYSSPLTARYATLNLYAYSWLIYLLVCVHHCYTEYTVLYYCCSGNAYDKMLLAKLESVYTGSGGPGSSMVSFLLISDILCFASLDCLSFLSSLQLVLNMEQGLPVWTEWLAFNRVTARARKGFVAGPVSFSFG